MSLRAERSNLRYHAGWQNPRLLSRGTRDYASHNDKSTPLLTERLLVTEDFACRQCQINIGDLTVMQLRPWLAIIRCSSQETSIGRKTVDRATWGNVGLEILAGSFE
jgi:hypothetical protein